MYKAGWMFLLGVAWVQQFARLPDGLEWALILLLLAAFRFLRMVLGFWLLFGVLWASAYGQWRLSEGLARDWTSKEVVVQGYILDLPERQDARVGFDFVVTQSAEGIPAKVHLNWYGPDVRLRAGQAFELTVKLKPPHGYQNPGSFDYEAWQFANHIGATGYVRTQTPPRSIEPPFSAMRWLAKARQLIADRLDQAMGPGEWNGVVKALTIGYQQEITPAQWQVFRATGVVHLMVISGSHITLIAGLVFWLSKRLWGRWGLLSVSPPTVAALTAWWAAVGYSALAGFSLPVQRALLMLSLGLAALIWQRNLATPRILMLALLAVVAFDPLALLSVGFWLSYGAVALLMYVSLGRLRPLSGWRAATQLHLTMAIGLSPLLLVFFQQVSVISPLANALAVPVVGLLITPLSLLAATLALVSPGLAGWVLWPVERLLQATGWVLQHMAAWPMAQLSSPEPTWLAVAMAGLGVLWLLAPKGLPARYLAGFLFLPLVFVPVKQPGSGEIWLTLLDVGQGLSAVVQTATHVLVFDTGAKYSEQFDMGEAVLLPYLRHQGIRHIDALVISHDQNDHSGGAESLMNELPVRAIYSSAAAWFEREHGQDCHAGQSWSWDGVTFTGLSPTETGFLSANDRSCVLKVGDSPGGMLLTGDIERAAETELAERYGSGLASQVMLAPHHGSKTSSTARFLDQVRPALILIPAGYANRFNFPHSSVTRRYLERHIDFMTTGEAGAITVKWAGDTMSVESYRQRHRHYWMQ